MKTEIETLCIRSFVVFYALLCVGAVSMEQLDKKAEQMSDYIVKPLLVNVDDITEGRIIAIGKDKADTVKIDRVSLETILKKDNYIEQSNNVALGMYIPIYIIEFNSKDQAYRVEYSVANAEVRALRNGVLEKTVLMYNPDTIIKDIESLF